MLTYLSTIHYISAYWWVHPKTPAPRRGDARLFYDHYVPVDPMLYEVFSQVSKIKYSTTTALKYRIIWMVVVKAVLLFPPKVGNGIARQMAKFSEVHVCFISIHLKAWLRLVIGDIFPAFVSSTLLRTSTIPKEQILTNSVSNSHSKVYLHTLG